MVLRLYITVLQLILLMTLLCGSVLAIQSSNLQDTSNYQVLPLSDQSAPRRLVKVAVPSTAGTTAGITQDVNLEGAPEYQLFPSTGQQHENQPAKQKSPSKLGPIARPEKGLSLPSDDATTDRAGSGAYPDRSTSLYGPRHPPWEPVAPSPVREQTRLFKVRQFPWDDGRMYGPFLVGGTRFQAKPYPLDVSFFRASYRFGSLKPANFERYGWGVLDPHDAPIFRPDPSLLRKLRQRIETPLRFHGWTPEPVDIVAGSAKEGEYLWPPSSTHPYRWELQMTLSNRQRMLRAAMSTLNAHSLAAPSAWTMTIPASGKQPERHVMMTPVQANMYTDLSIPNARSDVWLFHEAVMDAQRGRPRMALLGAMFLPKGAASVLQQEGFIRPAFSDILSHAH